MSYLNSTESGRGVISTYQKRWRLGKLGKLYLNHFFKFANISFYLDIENFLKGYYDNQIRQPKLDQHVLRRLITRAHPIPIINLCYLNFCYHTNLGVILDRELIVQNPSILIILYRGITR